MAALKQREFDGVNESVNLKQSKLSSSEYQKAKKLKAFDAKDWKWNAGEGLYIKVVNESVNEDVDDIDDDKDAIAQANAARGKHKKLDIAVKALKDITTEMKSLARDYSKADGVEKEKIKDQLKVKTPKKKELEALVAKLEKNVI
jgi:hypothetical protein